MSKFPIVVITESPHLQETFLGTPTAGTSWTRGIYILANPSTGASYVGSSRRIRDRVFSHFFRLNRQRVRLLEELLLVNPIPHPTAWHRPAQQDPAFTSGWLAGQTESRLWRDGALPERQPAEPEAMRSLSLLAAARRLARRLAKVEQKTVRVTRLLETVHSFRPRDKVDRLWHWIASPIAPRTVLPRSHSDNSGRCRLLPA